MKGEPIPGFKPVVCGRYFKLLITRATRPEKIVAMLEPHIKFVKHTLDECPLIETIYILAAGKINITTAKTLKTRIIDELRKVGLNSKIGNEEEYMGLYRGKPHMKLYVCKVEIKRQ